MPNDVFKLFTYTLIDGRKVTYAGLDEKQAFNWAHAYHGDALPATAHGQPAEECRCSMKRANVVRQGGWLVCANPECAGRIG